MAKDRAKDADRDKLLSQFGAVVGAHVADRVEERLKTFGERHPDPTRGSGGGIPSETRRQLTNEAVAQRGGFTTGRVLLAKAAHKWSIAADDVEPISAKDVAEKNWPDDESVQQALATKALISGELDRGGSFVEGGYRQDYIDLLTPRVSVRRLGPQVVPMPEGSMTISKVTSDVTAYYVGESQSITPSEPGTGARKLSARKLAVLVPLSNSLIRRAAAGRASISMEAFAQKLAIRRQGLREDLAFLSGQGTEHSPKGIYQWANTTLTANATVSFANVLADLGRCIDTLENADVPMVDPAWVMRARSKNYLMYQALDGLGRPFFMDMIQAGELLGYRFAHTSQIPGNGGVGGDESWLAFLDMDTLMLGETLDMVVSTSTEAAYPSGGGLASAFSQDETLLRLISEHDLVPEYDEGIVVLDQVTWGA